MEKAVPTLFNAQIRPMAPKDFAFVQSLAAELPQFTVPPDYILWFFTRFHPDYCRVLEQNPGELKAYLLAMPTSDPPSGIAIWQIAASKPIRAFALEYFSAYMRDLCDQTSASQVFFTMPDDPASLRLARSLASQFGKCVIERLGPVPSGQNEYEFRLSISTTSK